MTHSSPSYTSSREAHENYTSYDSIWSISARSAFSHERSIATQSPALRQAHTPDSHHHHHSAPSPSIHSILFSFPVCFRLNDSPMIHLFSEKPSLAIHLPPWRPLPPYKLHPHAHSGLLSTHEAPPPFPAPKLSRWSFSRAETSHTPLHTPHFDKHALEQPSQEEYRPHEPDFFTSERGTHTHIVSRPPSPEVKFSP